MAGDLINHNAEFVRQTNQTVELRPQYTSIEIEE